MGFIAFGFAVLFAITGFRLNFSYRRVITSLRSMTAPEKERLPPQIYSSLTQFSSALPSLAFSWWSAIFHEVTVGDVSWSKDLPCQGYVEETRKRFRLFLVALAAVLAVLVVTFVIESRKMANQPAETTAARAAVVRTSLHHAPTISPSLATASHL